MNDLKKKTASGFIYKFAERAGAQGISFILQIVLARILMPEDYGLVALVTVFITICDVFVTYGFGNALIVNQDSDSLDFSTCFYFCIGLSFFLYSVVFFGASYLAAFYSNYDKALLTAVVRVMGLRIIIAAINSVQQAYVSKHMRFKKFFYATLIGTIISGIIAVIMAYSGFGVWALVEQYLGNVMIDTICLWIIVGWRPTWEFSFTRLKAIYSYGWKILVVGLIDTVFSRLRNLIIGKKYNSEDLAYYTRGTLFPAFGMRLIEPTVNAVLFPALSACNGNREDMCAITKRVLQVSTFIISPFMIGLAVVARPMIVFLLTEKWLPSVIYVQIGCLADLFRCQQFINNSVIKASGRSDLLLKLDILKKSIGIVLILIAIQYGIVWIALSLVAFNFTSMIINVAPNKKILGYGYLEQFKDVIENIVPAVIMGVCIYPLGFLPISDILLLIIQVAAGVCLYVIMAFVLKNRSFFFALKYLKKILANRKKVA